MEMKDILKQHTDAIEKQFSTLDNDVQEALQKAKVAEGICFELEQKFARIPEGGSFSGHSESWGAQVIAKSADIQHFADQRMRKGSLSFDVKATLTTAAGSGGGLIVPARDATNILPRQRLTIRQLMNTVRVSTGSVEYPRQTGFTNAAATVAEGALKPESTLTYELVTTPVRVIAHWIPASRQVLEDQPQLQDLIDSDLRYGLALKEEAQLLNGDGVGDNLLGLITQATAFAPPAGAPAAGNLIDTIGLALLQQDLANLPADAIIMHPSDWLRMRMLKDTAGGYILGDPARPVEPVLFGRPVVATPAISVDKFLVGNFASATLYDRWQARVEISTEHADFFTRNMVAILCEERIGMALKRTAAMTYGDFGFVV